MVLASSLLLGVVAGGDPGLGLIGDRVCKLRAITTFAFTTRKDIASDLLWQSKPPMYA